LRRRRIDERNSSNSHRASARYFQDLAKRYNGDWQLAMAGYNTGAGNVDRAIARAGKADFWSIYPHIYPETRNYAFPTSRL
jgi:membrane-bound lytic murein transglycosylase D